MPIDKTNKLVEPRMLHATHWMVICPAETPEGGSVGLVKNLALGCVMSINTSPDPVLNSIKLIDNIGF